MRLVTPRLPRTVAFCRLHRSRFGYVARFTHFGYYVYTRILRYVRYLLRLRSLHVPHTAVTVAVLLVTHHVYGYVYLCTLPLRLCPVPPHTLPLRLHGYAFVFLPRYTVYARLRLRLPVTTRCGCGSYTLLLPLPVTLVGCVVLLIWFPFTTFPTLGWFLHSGYRLRCSYVRTLPVARCGYARFSGCLPAFTAVTHYALQFALTRIPFGLVPPVTRLHRAFLRGLPATCGYAFYGY